MKFYNLHYFLIFVSFFKGFAQEDALEDTMYIKIPVEYDLQGIVSEKSNDSLYIYIGFDGVKKGIIQQYFYNQDSQNPTFIKIKEFILPLQYRHPNDLQIINDTLIVTGWNGNNISYVGFFNKNDGSLLKEVIDTLEVGFWLQSLFIYKDIVYRLLSNGNDIFFQKYFNGNFFNEGKIYPSPIRKRNNYIQGSKVFFNRYLVILTSAPSRLDFFDIENNFSFIKSLFVDQNGETEGIGIFENENSFCFLYGIRPLNRINLVTLQRNLIKDIVINYPLPQDTLLVNNIILKWDLVNSAKYYNVTVSDDSLFNNIVYQQNNIRNSSVQFFVDELYKKLFIKISVILFGENQFYSKPFPIYLNKLIDTSIGAKIKRDGFYLFQNYPNPFNSETKIDFYLTTKSDIDIKIFDSNGRYLENSNIKSYEPGLYSFKFSGNGLASGIYYYSISVNGYTQIIKMLYLK